MMTRKGVEHAIEHPEEITQRFEEHVQDIGEDRKKSSWTCNLINSILWLLQPNKLHDFF